LHSPRDTQPGGASSLGTCANPLLNAKRFEWLIVYQMRENILTKDTDLDFVWFGGAD